MQEQKEQEIVIRWLDTSNKMIHDELMAGALSGSESLLDIKAKALDKLGIEVKEGEKPLVAYVRAMCEENGVAHTTPAPAEISDAILSSGASRFVWWLA